MNRPTLTPYQPETWPDKIVISLVIGTSVDATDVLPTNNLYLCFAVINDGAAATTVRHYH